MNRWDDEYNEPLTVSFKWAAGFIAGVALYGWALIRIAVWIGG